jgi:hypothetical protein
MANNTTTPNMGLTVPTPQAETGPEYATEISNNLTNVLDSHDHSSGKGVAVTPAGLNINADLTLNQNNIISARAIRYTSQPSGLVGVGDLNETFVRTGDLWYVNSSGQQVQVTTGGVLNVGTLSNTVLARQAVNNINWTILSSDTYILVDVNCSTTPVSISLPAANAVTAGRWFVIADKTGSSLANNITVGAAAGDSISGFGSFILGTAYASTIFISNGSTGWDVVGSVAGPQGIQGSTGPTGPIGPQGVTGPAGGPQGPTGAQGPQGVTGPVGPGSPTAGPQGSPGPTGPRGTTGPTGPAGPQGVQGATGVRGVTGATGPVGPAGATGSVALSNDIYQGVTGLTVQSIGGYTNLLIPTGTTIDINARQAINKSMVKGLVTDTVVEVRMPSSGNLQLAVFSLDDNGSGATATTFQNIVAKVIAINAPSGTNYGRWTLEADVHRSNGVTTVYDQTVLGPAAPANSAFIGPTLMFSGATGYVVVNGFSGVRWVSAMSRMRVAQ